MFDQWEPTRSLSYMSSIKCHRCGLVTTVRSPDQQFMALARAKSRIDQLEFMLEGARNKFKKERAFVNKLKVPSARK